MFGALEHRRIPRTYMVEHTRAKEGLSVYRIGLVAPGVLPDLTGLVKARRRSGTSLQERNAVNWAVLDQCTRGADSYLYGGARSELRKKGCHPPTLNLAYSVDVPFLVRGSR
jgi:hypothetical protein